MNLYMDLLFPSSKNVNENLISAYIWVADKTTSNSKGICKGSDSQTFQRRPIWIFVCNLLICNE